MTAATEGSVVVHSPADGAPLGVVTEHAAADVMSTVDDLRAAQRGWEAAGLDERIRWIGKYRDWLLDNADRLTDLLRAETGKPLAEANLEVGLSIDLINYYAERAPRYLAVERPWPHNLFTAVKQLSVEQRPYPVVGVITPWNFPLALTLFDSVPALIAGAAVIVKPSEQTPLAVRAAADGWADIGAPPVFACVTGLAETGKALVDTVDYVQFTGSTRTGKIVAQQAAARLIPYGLELGGKDPAIVLADADLEQTAAGIAFGGLSNAGQMCTSVERIYVEDAVHDEFVRHLVATVRGLRQNSAGGYDTDVGPLATEAQHAIVARHVADAVAKGATVHCGGSSAGGTAFQPTVLTNVDHTMDIMREETFGPVLPVMRVSTVDEAVRLANDTPYGLSASVWTTDKARGREIARRLEAGTVDVNDASAHLACYPVPQAGWKSSGIGGRLGGAAGIRKFCRTQTVVEPRVELSLIAALAWFPYSKTKGRIVSTMFRLLGARDVRRRLGLGRRPV
ncbi:betaine-aldehyde dehydrogenase [Herbihabitans rhizosphaerae]|uniref:Aldehyde dehydrogenase n=1 Tax=Herbihabitans rhizosphaerae TaxID=1872711 RepID=A0A4Q7L4Q9_9PSEU|nr:aldehyde dehydrogenase family protein [Herbihabitans rhizosphaerae]RZS43491.1 betaine-aldehyde dehydrogenase [Herbihabitans rhizosphaerae]